MTFQLSRFRKRVWFVSTTAVLISVLGLILSSLNPTINSPLRLGLDFTGGTQIQLERSCNVSCELISSSDIKTSLQELVLTDDKATKSPNLSQSRVQLLDKSQSLVLRLPFLSANQSEEVIEAVSSVAGPFVLGQKRIETIGPTLGGQLLKSSLISLFVAFIGIAVYISIRYDRRYAALAIIALIHDLVIVCGVFSWLGIMISLEVNSLFAVSLLTIAGYSVNDTVVIFDRIRERAKTQISLPFYEQIDKAVNSTLTRTIYTSGTTLLPLLALIFFGGETLYWFAVALALGVIVGSWSSIALSPTLLSLMDSTKRNSFNQ